MPISAQDAAELKAQGWTDAEIANAIPVGQGGQSNGQQVSQPQAVGRTLIAHGGGILGGGAGAIGGGAAAGALYGALAGSEVPVIGNIIGGVIGAGVGGYAGQKAQQAIEPTDTYEAQQQAAQEAQQQHPITTAATDIGASALASGGRFSPSTAISGTRGLIGALAGKGLTDDAKNVLMQSILNPAIGTGMSVAQGQGIPSAGELAGQAAGGALFAKSWLPHGRIPSTDEPAPEVNNGDKTTTDNSQVAQLEDTQPRKQLVAPRRFFGDENGIIDLDSEGNPITPEPKPEVTNQTKLLPEKASPSESGGDLQVSPDILNKVIENGATKPQSVQRIFPNLNLSDNDAAEVLRQANLMAELHINHPDESENQNATGIRENQGQPEQNNVSQSSENRSGENMVEQTPRGETQSVPQKSEPEVSGNKITNPVTGESKIVQSPLSDYNRYNELERQVKQVSSSGDPNALDKVQPLMAEMHQLENKYNGRRPPYYPEGHILMPLDIQSHIMSGRATTGSILQKLSVLPDYPLGPLSKSLLDASDTKSLGTPWLHNSALDRQGAMRSHYDMNSDRVNIGTGSAGDARVVMEEAIHSLTSKKIPYFAGQGEEHYNRLNTYLNKKGGNESVKDLIRSYFATAKHLGIDKQLFKDNKYNIQTYNPKTDRMEGPPIKALAGNPDEAEKQIQGFGATTKYAMGDLHEFIAQALKDPEFQRVLKDIPSDKPSKSVWNSIKDAVLHLLGLDKSHESMLSKVLDASHELVKQERPTEKSAGDYTIIHPETGKKDGTYLVENSKTGDSKEFKTWEEAHKYIDDTVGNINTLKQAAPKEDLEHTTPDKLQLPKDKYMGRWGATTRAVIDKVRDIGSPEARNLGDKAQMALDKETELKGRWKNVIVQAGEKLSSFDKAKLQEVFNREMASGKRNPVGLTNQAQRNFYNVARTKIDESGKHRLAIGEPVTQALSVGGRTIYAKRNLKQDESYFPGMANQKVAQTYRENVAKKASSILPKEMLNPDKPNQDARERLDELFHEYNTEQLGLTPKESAKRIENYKTALQGSTARSNLSDQAYFNAHRKAQGTPLPPSFREADPVRNLERYFDRAAVDSAHYEHMEKDPSVLAALGQTKDAWGNDVPQLKNGSLANNPAVHHMLAHWRGEAVSPAEGNESSLSSLISSGFIAGPALELHKIVSNTVKALANTSDPVTMVRAVTHALTNINTGYQHAVENGVVKLTARSASQMIAGSSTSAERLQSLARVIRRVSTLNDLTTKVGSGLVQSMNEVIIPSKVARANAGDISSQMFIKRLDPTYTKGKQYDDQAMQQLASRSANYIHGTGDIRSLPAWMLNDSEFSGFFSLAHWSIAQTNNFMKEVYEPATRGDLKPLLTGMFGAAIGGYLIKELRQDIQGKKSPIPSLSEIANSDKGVEGNPGLVGYNMIAALQYAGFGGLLSQVAKYPFDFAYKNPYQGATFPMDEVAQDIVDSLHSASEAIANDPNLNWVDLAKVVSMHVLSTNFQLGRIAINQSINHGLITGLPAEKKELADKMGQLRRFDMVEGLPYNDIDAASSSYMNLEQKKFKTEQDLPTAMKELPSLVSNIMQTYHDKPDVLMSKLQALKENQYSTFPDMDKMPLSFMKYMGYLQKTEGTDAAHAELMDYMKHRIINETKASVIP